MGFHPEGKSCSSAPIYIRVLVLNDPTIWRSYAALASIFNLGETSFDYELKFDSLMSAVLSGRSFYGISYFPFEADTFFGYSVEVRADATTLDVSVLPTDAYATVHMRSYGRGLHSSSFQLNLSRFCHKINPI
jgi:hypothetical protein